LIQSGTTQADQVTDVQPYKIKTGEVEKGDTLSNITKEVNTFYGTKYNENDMANINQRSFVLQTKEGDTIRFCRM
jgi:hypothetical protein